MFRNLSTDAIGVSGRQSELIELALSFGFKGIDLDIEDFYSQVQASGLPHARRLLDSSRLKIGTFRLPIIWDQHDALYQEQLPKLSQLLGLAKELGCKRCVTTVAPANDLRPYHENFEFHRRRLTELAGLLAPLDMKLGLQFVATEEARHGRSFQFVQSLDALVLLTGMVNANNIGIVVDLWQMHVAGNSLDDAKKLPADRMIAVYVSDTARPEDASVAAESQRTLPGETGVIDSSSALTALAEMGYDGPVTPITHPSQAQGMRRDAVVKLAGERLDAVWKAAGLNASGKLAATAGTK